MLDSIKSDKVLKQIGQRIRQARKSFKHYSDKKDKEVEGISLRDLATLANVSHTQIDDIENGRLNPTILTLLSITEALNISIGELFEGKKRWQSLYPAHF